MIMNLYKISEIRISLKSCIRAYVTQRLCNLDYEIKPQKVELSQFKSSMTQYAG